MNPFLEIGSTVEIMKMGVTRCIGLLPAIKSDVTSTCSHNWFPRRQILERQYLKGLSSNGSKFLVCYRLGYLVGIYKLIFSMATFGGLDSLDTIRHCPGVLGDPFYVHPIPCSKHSFLELGNCRWQVGELVYILFEFMPYRLNGTKIW